VEDIIFNLVNLIDVERTNTEIEKYKQKNAEKITFNQMRKNENIKREYTTIKEEEDTKKLHDMQFHVLSHSFVFSHIFYHTVCIILYKESLKLKMDSKREQKRQINQIMLGVSA